MFCASSPRLRRLGHSGAAMELVADSDVPRCESYVLKPVRTPVAILGSLGVCIYVPASRHWLISYSPIHLI